MIRLTASFDHRFHISHDADVDSNARVLFADQTELMK